MFGSTSAHGINAPAHNLLALSVAEISDRYPSFAHLVRAVRRSMLAAASPPRRRRRRGSGDSRQFGR
ncbi:tetR family transcriptional regulator [Mycobacterium xenopi 4042]|uniref:TetR family transcriptional regulator n=1 Tax=Mycobacterium xenopi 4042 TaxID=1299334 RepID=X7ZZS4_MYCXE|nr:tetR family transcriptional regulator [Mycobacterium xenopi 4042]